MDDVISADVLANPRKEDGGLGDYFCESCGSKSGAYISINDYYALMNPVVTVCKGCLLKWVDEIDATILGRCRGD